MSRYARRKDANHAAVVEVFRLAGLGILDVAGLGDLGCDLIVTRGERYRYVEIKDGTKAPSQCKLTDSEARLKLLHPQTWRLVSTADEAIAVVKELL